MKRSKKEVGLLDILELFVLLYIFIKLFFKLIILGVKKVFSFFIFIIESINKTKIENEEKKSIKIITEKQKEKVNTQENKINLNKITTSLIGRILYKTEAFEKSDYLNRAIKPVSHMSEVIEKIYIDAIEFNSIDEFEIFYSPTYISKLIKGNYSDIRQGILRYGDLYSEDVEYISRRVVKQLEDFMIEDLFLDNTNNISYIGGFNNSCQRWWNPDYTGRRRYEDNTYENFMHLILLISSAFCISKILYINNMISKISSDSEVYKIVKNMINSINDTDTILDKLKPLHDEFYREEFGNINSDNLYIIAASVLIERVKSEEVDYKMEKEEAASIDKNILNKITTVIEMRGKEAEKINIKEEIIDMICSNNKSCNLKDYIEIICTIPSLEEKYYEIYNSNKNLREKERYLTSNFDIETC